jgi:hypothetical protein
MTTIECPHCRSTLTLDKVGVHFQKFCSGLQVAGAERESSMKKFNRLYIHMQSHARGEITESELQAEADRIFPGR